MVKKGCLEYFTKEKMKGRFEDNFDKEMMQEMCERLFDHYREDVIQGNYKIGV